MRRRVRYCCFIFHQFPHRENGFLFYRKPREDRGWWSSWWITRIQSQMLTRGLGSRWALLLLLLQRANHATNRYPPNHPIGSRVFPQFSQHPVYVCGRGFIFGSCRRRRTRARTTSVLCFPFLIPFPFGSVSYEWVASFCDRFRSAWSRFPFCAWWMSPS